MEIARIRIFHFNWKLINEMVLHVLQPFGNKLYNGINVCSPKTTLVFSPDGYGDLSVWAYIVLFYCMDSWMYVHHGRCHVGYHCLFEVSRDMLSVDVMIIIQEVDHEVVMLKAKKDFNP